MTLAQHHFKDITLLITHFNRSASLQSLLSTFRELNCQFEDIVVSDDCSDIQHQESLRNLQKEFNFRLITSGVNRGLANNINKGQDAVKTEYTLYVQEDFIPLHELPGSLKTAFGIMEEQPDIDLVRFYSYLPYPYTRPYKGGFSEMQFKPWGGNYYKVYAYSDHPHLRRSNFLEKFGRYVENIPSDRAEYRMCISFIQNNGTGLLFDRFKTLFDQHNPEAEPSTVTRKSWTVSSNVLVRMIRHVYRQVRYNYDLQFSHKITPKTK